MNSLSLFSQYTAQWFRSSLGAPTAVQEAAWPAIAAGDHTLVSAPTGTGKTLSAFLVFVDRLKNQAREGSLKQELQLIYISPLKSLAGDIRENLNRPLAGIAAEEYKKNISQDTATKEKETSFFGASVQELDIAIRTGDTTQSERRRMIKKPPHILITTPESLYLMATSISGRSILQTARAIIIDELHALIDSKRGAHLMLTIARLDKLCGRNLQRIGLSATIEPLNLAAAYLSPDPVTIAVPAMHKKIELKITSPLSDSLVKMRDPIWQELANTVYAHCQEARSVIAFTEGRMYAEKLAYFVNQTAGEGFARTHHGSLSKEQRFEVEEDLRQGRLRMLCATSSMELGIDVGEIDRVFQIGCPRSISSTMQRLGRAGHNPNRVSVMYMFPRTAPEGLYCGMTAEVARAGGVEHAHPPRLCLDVLSQHLVSMAVARSYDLDEVMTILARAYPFRQVTVEDVKAVLCMLAGDYEHQVDIPVRPRILYDRIHGRVEGDAYSRMLAVSSGGTIPDKGMYSAKTETGAKLGELDEEFVFESRVGDRFTLGTFGWQIVKIEKDSVIVKQSAAEGARLPFWKGEGKGRGLQTGLAFGRIFRRLFLAHETDTLLVELSKMGLDEPAAQNAYEFLLRQMEATEVLPDDRTILVEHFCNESGDHQMMVHSVFGRQVNAPLALLVQEATRRQADLEIGCVDEESGFLLYSYGGEVLPEGLLQGLNVETARPILEAILPVTPLFNMTFRYNSAHALMMGVRKAGRLPLWVQRMRSTQMLESVVRYQQHPLIRETRRECLEDYWDLNGVELVLRGIQSGEIKVREFFLETPSPMSLPLQWKVEADNMYDYYPAADGVQEAAKEALEQVRILPPSQQQLELVSERKKLPEDEKQLHTLLMIEGDLIAGELDVPIQWLEDLAEAEQAVYIEPGLWIAAEHGAEYAAALTADDAEARRHIVRRALRYRGAQSPEQIAERYFWNQAEAEQVLQALCSQENAVEADGIYYHAQLYQKAQHQTIRARRMEMRTLPPERYAALLADRLRILVPAAEQLEAALDGLCGQPFLPALWESVLLPGRVGKYRQELLDGLLAKGGFFWNFTPGLGLQFSRYRDIDWDADMTCIEESLSGAEKQVYEALRKRGASFAQALSIPGVDRIQDTLQSLAEAGLVYADSFAPVRQNINRKKLEKAAVRQRIGAKVKALSAGRWDLVRPLLPHTAEQQLEAAFDRAVLLCRETAGNLLWGTALETLRIWEYIGRVRRGYFIEGLSGAQFIRETDFLKTIHNLEQPSGQERWISAIDPAQPWGKILPHHPGKGFMNIAGTAVGLLQGAPIVAFERKGAVLRVFDEAMLLRLLNAFVEDYEARRIFSDSRRIVVKEYPESAGKALMEAGFRKEIRDYVLYRK